MVHTNQAAPTPAESVSVTHFKHNKIVTQMLALGNEPKNFLFHFTTLSLIPDVITIALSR